MLRRLTSNAARAAVVLAGSALLLAACDKPKPKEAEIRPVRSVVAHAQALSVFPSQVGDIRSHSEIDLGFKISGKILERNVDLGAVVKRGDVLARLDDQDQSNELTAAQANLASAQAKLVQAQAEERRQAKLRADGWATQAKYDAALQARDSARAEVRAADANLRLAQDRHGYAVLRAPEDGAISAVGAEAGQVVAAGQMVVRLARLDQKDAVFTLAESTLLNLPRDADIEVRLLDAPGVEAHGRIEQISPSADPVTRTYTVKVALSDPPPAMRLGMTVVGQLKWSGTPVITLPAAALSQQDGQPAVWVVDPQQSTVSPVKVTLRQSEADYVLVASGLNDGAIVVTAGVQSLWPGEKVRLLDGGAEGAKLAGEKE